MSLLSEALDASRAWYCTCTSLLVEYTGATVDVVHCIAISAAALLLLLLMHIVLQSYQIWILSAAASCASLTVQYMDFSTRYRYFKSER